MPHAEYGVLIADHGRSGSVDYVEGDLRLPLWWEFTMDGAWVWAPSPGEWDAYWSGRGALGAVGRRKEILARVAEACVRKRAPSAKAEVDSDGVTLRFQGAEHEAKTDAALTASPVAGRNRSDRNIKERLAR